MVRVSFWIKAVPQGLASKSSWHPKFGLSLTKESQLTSGRVESSSSVFAQSTHLSSTSRIKGTPTTTCSSKIKSTNSGERMISRNQTLTTQMISKTLSLEFSNQAQI